MRRRIAVWLAGSALGAVLLGLPDDGPRLVAFSDAHGLTALDALGATVLVGAWLAPASMAWRRRRELEGRWAGSAAFAAGAGCGLVVASVSGDFAGWWAVGAGILTAVQLAVFGALAGPRR